MNWAAAIPAPPQLLVGFGWRRNALVSVSTNRKQGHRPKYVDSGVEFLSITAYGDEHRIRLLVCVHRHRAARRWVG